jgi:hypothetical protein
LNFTMMTIRSSRNVFAAGPGMTDEENPKLRRSQNSPETRCWSK